MMEFKIVVSPDKTQQGNYQHFGQTLVFGQQEGDMILDDGALGPAQLKVSWQNGGFVVENLHPQVEVRLNGHPITGPSPLRERENITMGRTTIHFSRLDLQPLQPPAPYQHPQAESRFAPGTKESIILEVLEAQEKMESGGPTAPPPLPGAAPTPPPPPGMPPLPPGIPRKP
jgi:hypothetical protein